MNMTNMSIDEIVEDFYNKLKKELILKIAQSDPPYRYGKYCWHFYYTWGTDIRKRYNVNIDESDIIVDKLFHKIKNKPWSADNAWTKEDIMKDLSSKEFGASIQEVVRLLLYELTDEEKEALIKSEKDARGKYGIGYHFSLGLYIRNKYHWYGVEGDDKSSMAIDLLIRTLKNESIDYDNWILYTV